MDKLVSETVDTFYKVQLAIFKSLGLFDLPAHYSPRCQLALRAYFWHVAIVWMVVFDVSMWIQIIRNITDMNEIIKVFYLFAMAIAVMAKFSRIRLKSKSYIALFTLMHSPDFFPVNPQEMGKFMQAAQLSRRVRNSYLCLSLTSLTLVYLTQLIVDSSALPLSIYVPINVDKTWCFLMVYLYQVIALSICCFLNIAFDSLGASFFIYLKSQLDILSNRLENVGRNHENSQMLVNHQLKECIRYYVNILRMTRSMEDLVSIPMSVQVMSSVLVLVSNFYAMTFLSDPSDYVTFIKFLIYQLCMLTQIFILCYFANEVSLKSMDLSYALYSSEWVHCSKVNRKLMLIMMAQFDIPICIKTINRCYSFNLAAFTSIVNSSYSYFALLKKMNS